MKDNRYIPLQLIESIQQNFGQKFNIEFKESLGGIFETEDYLVDKIKKHIASRLETEGKRKGMLEFQFKTEVDREFNNWRSKNDSLCMLWYLANEWRKEKKVYTVNYGLLRDLAETEDAIIPEEVISKLPEKTMYIDLKQYSGNFINKGIDLGGIIISLVHGEYNKEKYTALAFSVLDGMFKTQCMVLNMDKLRVSIYSALDGIFEQYNANDRKDLRELTRLVLQMYLYINNPKADVKENEEQKKIYKKPSNIKDKFSEVQKWDLGGNYPDLGLVRVIMKNPYWKIGSNSIEWVPPVVK